MRLCDSQVQGHLAKVDYRKMVSYRKWLTAIVTFCIAVTLVRILAMEFVKPTPQIMVQSRAGPEVKLVDDLIEVKTTNTLYQRLQLLEQNIKRAKLHVRGTKTSKELRKATKLMDEIMELFPRRDPLPWRKTEEPKSVCQEEYFPEKKDSKWFGVRNCTHATSIEELVSVVIFIKDDNKSRLEQRINTFLKSFPDIYKNVTVIMANMLNLNAPKGSKPKVKVLKTSGQQDTDGDVWNMLVKEVTTPYVFVARDIEVLTDDARFDRLIREMETLQIPVASGAVRHHNGHWQMGCFQTVYKNCTLKYFEGYDESFHECVFCDYSVGPFLTTVNTLKSFPFAGVQDAGLFNDWFLRITKKKLETILCPDAMFYLHQTQEAKTWPQFMTKWNLLTVYTSSGLTITSGCVGRHLIKTATKALSPCLLEENFQHTSTLMSICENNTMICELNCGTLLGALKLSHVLPWEIDADISVLHTDFDKYRYVLSKRVKLTAYAESCDFRFFSAIFDHWAVDLCERFELSSGRLVARGLNQTKVLFNGQWLATPANPGLFARVMYGRGIYQHANHFSHTKTDPRAAYKTNRFLPCSDPQDHDCLDQYNGDGNLQFKYTMP